mmetsp:Transcript_11252/g.24238  ORF Transcript_11252/g.24238 Transcript_11252/m.24238 type:complete len:249 (-) Transcript_11252:166-912(-)
MTATTSQRTTLQRRWATSTTVTPRLRNRSSSTARTLASASRSKAAVASSTSNTRDSRSATRATHSNCLCPVLRFPPSSATEARRPSGSSDNPTHFSAASRAASSCCWKGSRFSRIVPLKNRGSWLRMASWWRRAARGMALVSTPSRRILPPHGDTSRARANKMELFPLPVRPTRPMCCPGWISSEIPRSAGGKSGEYRNSTFSTTKCPVGVSSGHACAASCFVSSCGTSRHSANSTSLARAASRTNMP